VQAFLPRRPGSELTIRCAVGVAKIGPPDSPKKDSAPRPPYKFRVTPANLVLLTEPGKEARQTPSADGT
jgi:hypothetical protein